MFIYYLAYAYFGIDYTDSLVYPSSLFFTDITNIS